MFYLIVAAPVCLVAIMEWKTWIEQRTPGPFRQSEILIWIATR